jgi:hypothetical protein
MGWTIPGINITIPSPEDVANDARRKFEELYNGVINFFSNFVSDLGSRIGNFFKDTISYIPNQVAGLLKSLFTSIFAVFRRS